MAGNGPTDKWTTIARDGWTPLHHAARDGDLEALAQAAREGADLNTPDQRRGRKTPLHMVAAAGNAEAVRLLLGAGAKVDAKDSKGNQPLHAANHSNPEAIQALIDGGADVNFHNLAGETALIIATQSGADVATVRALLAGGDADIRVVAARGGDTALHYAASYCGDGVVQLLLGYGADVNAVNANGMTPLHLAKDGATAKALLTAGADARARDRWGTTPLYRAAERGCEAAVEALLAAGAEPNASVDGGFGSTPIDAARGQGHMRIAEMIRRAAEQSYGKGK